MSFRGSKDGSSFIESVDKKKCKSTGVSANDAVAGPIDHSRLNTPYVFCSNGNIYGLIKCLGAGQFGQVFEAYQIMSQNHLRTEGNLVVKFVDGSSLFKFEQELEILKKVSNIPGFCKLVDRGISDSVCTQGLGIYDMTPFFIMDKLGDSLIDVYEKMGNNMRKTDVLKIGI
jgi:serine/threonine protein kinase